MSRKKQNIQKTTALYCRLSLEDGRENESMSISNQKLMLKDFAKRTECSATNTMWTMATLGVISIVRRSSG